MTVRLMSCNVCGVQYLDTHDSCTFCREPITNAKFIKFVDQDYDVDGDVNGCDDHNASPTSESYSEQETVYSSSYVGKKQKVQFNLGRLLSNPKFYVCLFMGLFAFRFLLVVLSAFISLFSMF